MKTSQKRTKISFFVSCIFMMLTLAWLTVSLPFVYAAQQAIELNRSADTINTDGNQKQNEEENNNLFANTTEEKTSNSMSSLSEEYLHDTHSSEHHFDGLSIEYKVEHMATYIAFYGELISPPPEVT